MKTFTKDEIKILKEFGFTVEPNHARRVREDVIEIINVGDTYCTTIEVRQVLTSKMSSSLGEAMSNIDMLRDQIRKELKQLLQQL